MRRATLGMLCGVTLGAACGAMLASRPGLLAQDPPFPAPNVPAIPRPPQFTPAREPGGLGAPGLPPAALPQTAPTAPTPPPGGPISNLPPAGSPNTAPWAGPVAPPLGPPQGSTNGLIALSSDTAEGTQQVVLVDPTTRVMAVYHVEKGTGRIALKSVRRVEWDLQMDEFNGASPLTREVQAMLKR